MKKKTIQQRLLEQTIRDAPCIRKDSIHALLYLVELGWEHAERIIEHCNIHNRKLRQNSILDWAKSMDDNEWLLKATLEFFDNGFINDGQHRLRALVQAKGKEHFWVQILRASHATTESAVTDIGPHRSVGDFLHFEQVHDAYRTSPFLMLERNNRVSRSPHQKCKTSRMDLLNLYDEIGEESVKATFDIVPKRMHVNLGVPRSFLDWFSFHARKIDDEGAQLFLQYVSLPEGLKSSDPMFVLHSKLKELALRKARRSASISLHDQTSSVVKAWNLHYEHQPCTAASLRYRVDEDWPQMKGE